MLDGPDLVRRALHTSLKKTIQDHGPVTADLFTSLYKRFLGEIKTIRNEAMKHIALAEINCPSEDDACRHMGSGD